jgi:hypothetical protein
VIQVITPVPPNANSVPGDWLPAGEGYAWRLGKPIANLTDLGNAIAADPNLPSCISGRMWNWAMSRGDIVNDQVVLTPTLSNRLTGILVQNNWNVKELVRQIFNDPNFVRY